MKRDDRSKLKHLYNNGGYVLNFSNATFASFILETLDFDPYDRYEHMSKGKLLTRIIEEVDDKKCILLANRLLEEAKNELERINDRDYFLLDDDNNKFTRTYEILIEKTEDILRKYENNVESEIDINLNADTYTNMYDLREAVYSLFDKGLYDQAVDRVHTLMHSYLAQQCVNLNLKVFNEKNIRRPLNELFSTIVNDMCKKDLINSNLTKMILQNSKKILENFNNARNSESAAHPTENWLQKEEARYVINTIINTIKLLDSTI